MRKISYDWHIVDKETRETEKRYCPQCRRSVWFTDSWKRRRNGNGKNIYEYAIYKCEKDHTWNKKIAEYKAGQIHNHQSETSISEEIIAQAPIPIDLVQLKERGYDIVEIRLQEVQGKWRLDKLLSEHLIGISRTQIQRWIEDRIITIDNQKTKPGTFLHRYQKILLDLLLEHF